MNIISIANQKGGVGKTTVSVNLASALKELKKKVLLIDMDPQGNSTTGIGIDKKNLYYSVYDLMADNTDFSKIMIRTVSGVDVIPSEVELSSFDINFYSKPNKEFLLKDKISNLKYDYIIIDCPPSLGLLNLNALVASNFVVIPIQCEFYALEGVSQMINTINLIKTKLNPKLELGGILINMFDPWIRIQREILKELENHFSNKILKTFLKKNVRLTEASSYGMPINLYEENSKGHKAFMDIAKEVIKLGISK